jgi:hypothetical protein
MLEESLSISRELDIRWGMAYSLEIKGLLLRSQGKFRQAFAMFKESLHLSAEQENVQGILNCFGAIAGLAAVNGQPVRAARLFAAAENLRRTIGTRMGSDDQREYDYYRSLLRDQLDAGTFRRVWEEGCSMTVEQVLEELDRE